MGMGLWVATAGAANLAPVPAPSPVETLRERARIQTPVVFRETGSLSRGEFPLEANAVELDASKADLEVRVLEDESTGRSLLQGRIRMTGVNQSVLPLDRYGKIKREALALTGRPFMTFHLPDGKKRQLGVLCNPDVCESVDTRFPFTPGKEMKMSMETNIRGLNGKNWFFFINQFSPDARPDLNRTQPRPLTGAFKGMAFLTQWVPFGGKSELLLNWGELTLEPEFQSPYVKLLRRARFEAIEGEILASASRGLGMENLNLRPGERTILQAGDFVGLRNLSKARSRLRVFELN